MTIKHLDGDYINPIAFQLDEDVYGANGDLDDLEVKSRLMEAIVSQCNYHIAGHSGLDGEKFIGMSVEEHASKPALTLSQAADLIFGVWAYKDCQYMEAVEAGEPSLTVGTVQ
jgi:hypothetical protein